MFFHLLVVYPFISSRRAALEKWKQNLGHNATYNKLIDVFKQAGYQGYADHVYVVLQSQCTSLSHNYFSLHT